MRIRMSTVLLPLVSVVAAAAFLVPATGAATARVPAPTVAARPAAKPVYPREVATAGIADASLRAAALHATPPVTVLVELAPGVYANRGPGPLGNLDDYPAVFGRCVDVNRYSRSHRVAAVC
jgi:hypothetical protein